MLKAIVSILLTTSILCLSCSKESTNSNELPEENQSPQVQSIRDYQSSDLTWLDDVDAKTDANNAIQNGDFRLLAFTGRARTFPGIEDDISQIQQQCGYQLLANSSDALNVETELSARKQLYQYAATYNQIVSVECYKKHFYNNKD